MALAVELHCLPDELTERFDRIAMQTGRRWQDVFAEMLAHYELNDRDEKARKNSAEVQRYLAESK